MENSKGVIKKNVVLIGMFCRAMIIVLLFIPTIWGKFDEKQAEWYNPSQKEFLVLLLLPMSCLYLVFFVKFIVQNRVGYLRKGEITSFRFMKLGYFALLALFIVELVFITYRGLYPESFDIESLFLSIGVVETLFAAYAGLYLTDLFSL